MGDCEDCREGCFPYYGLAPHTHRLLTIDSDTRIGDSYATTTTIEPRETWPASFVEDPDCPGMGTYYCPDCWNGGSDGDA